jgi:hypothetical protein
MINILVSLVLFAALKVGFMCLFVPKRERIRPIVNTHLQAEQDAPIVERHDRRSTSSSLGSEAQGLNRLGVGDIEKRILLAVRRTGSWKEDDGISKWRTYSLEQLALSGRYDESSRKRRP